MSWSFLPDDARSEPFSEGVEKKKTQIHTLSRLCLFSEMAGLEALLFNAQDGYLGKTERKKEREKRREKEKMPRVSFFLPLSRHHSTLIASFSLLPQYNRGRRPRPQGRTAQAERLPQSVPVRDPRGPEAELGEKEKRKRGR